MVKKFHEVSPGGSQNNLWWKGFEK